MANPAPIEVCSALLTKTEGATSNGAIAETATTLTADGILLLADGPAGSQSGPHCVEPPVLARGLEGPLLAHCGHCLKPIEALNGVASGYSFDGGQRSRSVRRDPAPVPAADYHSPFVEPPILAAIAVEETVDH